MAKKKVDPSVPASKNAVKAASAAKVTPKAKAAPKEAKPQAGGKAVGVKAPAAKKGAKPTAAGREFSSEEIGHVAGDVWRVLSEQGTKTAAELTKAVAAPAELVAAALGWLAREDKLGFETNGRTVSVSLL